MAPADSEFEHLVELRRELHRYPELRFDEHRTVESIVARLPSGTPMVTEVAGTGLVVTIAGAEPGPAVLLRADMDAYPVGDAKTVDYASRTPGVCHACGHDVHVTVAYAVACRLLADPPRCGTVRVLFQPAEEIPFGQPSGGAAVRDSGVFAGQRFDAVLGLHCWPDLPAGAIGVDPGIAMAAKDAFRVRLRGRAAHAATPARGRDAILGLSALVSGLHAAIARRRDPHDLVAFNVGTLSGGSTQSVVADRAEATGTLRTHDPAVRQRLKEVVERVARAQADTFDLGLDFTWANEMPPIVNDPGLVSLAVRELVPVARVVTLAEPPMTSDDFALLGVLGPLLYLKLGVGGGAGGAPLHSATFDVDEACLPVGVAALERLTRVVLSGAGRAGSGSACPPVDTDSGEEVGS